MFQLSKPRRRGAVDDAMNNSSVSATPVMVDVGQRGEEVPLDFSGPRIGDWS